MKSLELQHIKTSDVDSSEKKIEKVSKICALFFKVILSFAHLLSFRDTYFHLKSSPLLYN